ncbi:MAG: beta-propeller domain-containing protein, partial [Mycobacteriales bacterium]
AKPHARPVAAALRPFGDCTALVKALRAEALDEVTPYGLPQPGFGGNFGVPVAVPAAGTAGGMSGSGTTGGSAGGAMSAAAPGRDALAFSETNNQEAGVDEPDTVKTDGTIMVLVRQSAPSLELLDVTGARPRHVGHLPVALPGGGLSLLMTGDTVVVLGQRYAGNGNGVVVAEVYSVRSPAHPTHLRTFRVEGQLLDARFVHGRILLVARSAPSIRFANPPAPGATAARAALAANRSTIRHTDADDWLPSVRVTPHGRNYPAHCDQASHPGVASGTTSTSIVTLDPDADAPTSNRTVVGGGDMLYASSKALYLATTSWQSQGLIARGLSRGVSTDLHGFDITDPDKPSYLGSGSLPGSLVDRYALSEDNGYLRVATTVGNPAPPGGEGPAPRPELLSDNRVTVLKPVDGALQKVGEVRGLGLGQRIFGVRFLGDIGYVVTFRSIDPLYTLDLSDPRHPMTKGALHISGFSSALYPLSSGKLLGVGQAVSAAQQQLGAQAEVFDVSVLARPRLTGKLVWANASSPAATDHHSLLWWAPRNLVVMPLIGYSGSSSAVVLRVGTTGRLTELGRVRPPGRGDNQCCGTVITRALVVGDLLYSITDIGVVTNPVDKVDQQRWLPFR